MKKLIISIALVFVLFTAAAPTQAMTIEERNAFVANIQQQINAIIAKVIELQKQLIILLQQEASGIQVPTATTTPALPATSSELANPYLKTPCPYGILGPSCLEPCLEYGVSWCYADNSGSKWYFIGDYGINTDKSSVKASDDEFQIMVSVGKWFTNGPMNQLRPTEGQSVIVEYNSETQTGLTNSAGQATFVLKPFGIVAQHPILIKVEDKTKNLYIREY